MSGQCEVAVNTSSGAPMVILMLSLVRIVNASRACYEKGGVT